ncbi:hypothetical protein V8E53_010892 [Lactarius tabidus]
MHLGPPAPLYPLWMTSSSNKTVDEIQIWTCRLPALTYSSTRAPLSAPETTPAPSQLPPPHNSIPLPIPLPGVADAEALMTGREQRVRKSVNYAELKLNTKMRKLDSVLPTQSRPRLPADDDEESDGAQVDEEPRRIEGPHGPGERRHWCAPAECGREHLKAIFDRG